METRPSLDALPFGLLELDAAGTVTRYSPAQQRQTTLAARDILGRNFFTEVMPARQVSDLQSRFRLFMAQGETLDRSSFIYASEHGPVKVQVLLARVTEKSDAGSEHFALVRIMPETT
ncbi:MAG TPA: PAS domain-containing protein [Pyrinomonadaceae bacterium]|jgi:photoactive yellow protein